MKRDKWEGEKIKERKKIFKILGIFSMLAFVVFVGYHLFLTLNLTNEKLRILEIAQEDIAQLRIQNLELVLEKGEIVSIEYIEKEARDKLRYSQEDEVLFVIPEELLESEWIEQELEAAKGLQKKEEEKDTEEIIKIWLDFLFVNGV